MCPICKRDFRSDDCLHTRDQIENRTRRNKGLKKLEKLLGSGDDAAPVTRAELKRIIGALLENSL